MDKQVTLRFYNVSRDNASVPSMIDTLRSIVKETDLTKREKRLTSDYTVRLEMLEDDGQDAVVGELVRCQNTNLPAEIDGKDRKQLTADRLGHSVVFRLNFNTGKLGMQFDSRVVSPGRYLEYLAAHDARAMYRIDPIISSDAWQRFKASPSRKFAVRIAEPEHLTSVSGAGEAAASGIQRMGEAYEGAFISVEISMGNRKGFLSGIQQTAEAILNAAGSGAHIQSMKATIVENDESEGIDLIEERVVARETLGLHDRDPVVNWQIKRDFIKSEMKRLVG